LWSDSSAGSGWNYDIANTPKPLILVIASRLLSVLRVFVVNSTHKQTHHGDTEDTRKAQVRSRANAPCFSLT
jgi:hypothetical protein